MASQASADIAPNARKPARHDCCSMSQASGVPVSSRPAEPMPSAVPDTDAKRSPANWRAMNTVHTRNAGAQPMPMSTWPSTSGKKLCDIAATSAPTIASGKAVSTVRRTPYRSMPIPMKSCSAPKAK